MGAQNDKNIITYNTEFAIRPNTKKHYENIMYDYLFPRYRFITQYHLFDFYLVDYNLYIELDEEHHFNSDNSKKRVINAIKDANKIKSALESHRSLLRISWFAINNCTYKKIIKKCVLQCHKINKLFLSSYEIYANHDMLNDIDKNNIIFINKS